MTEAEMIDKLSAACEAYHHALDMAFAMLIDATSPMAKSLPQFLPSKSPMWPAAVRAQQLATEVAVVRMTTKKAPPPR